MTKNSWRLTRRITAFFQGLQWKLTLIYTLFTVATILILGIVALGLVWLLNFYSTFAPRLVADGLNRASPTLASYLEKTPPDKTGLNQWLEEGMVGDSLIIQIPREDAIDETDTIPAQFGRVEVVAIVDQLGHPLAAIPPNITSRAALEAQFTEAATQGFQAALKGETEPSLLSARDGEFLMGAAPIFDETDRVIGVIFVKSTLFFGQGELIQAVLQHTILPVAGGMLVVGVIAGVLFGFFSGRWLTRRLRTLDEVADAWGTGNFEILAPDTSTDELGHLARHLNSMALQLQNLLQTRQGLAALEERNRLARDLHDSVKQQVFATAMQVGAAKALIDRDPAEAKTHLAEAEQLVRQSQQELTALIQELRPAALEGKGLTRALNDYATDWSRRSNIAVELRVSGERPLPLPIEQTLFRVAQEALANIARHSQAATAEVYLVWQEKQVTLIIADNGLGFTTRLKNGKGIGLQSMRERIEVLGGQLTVKSRLGRGTEVIAVLNNVTEGLANQRIKSGE